jgi:hypothetical protein
MPDYTVSKAAEKNVIRDGLWTKTTDATVTAAATIATTSNKIYLVKAFVVATSAPTLTTNQAAYGLVGLFKNIDGTLALVGSVGTLFTAIETDAAWDCTLAASGTSINVNVTGVAATGIVWHVKVDLSVAQNYADVFGPY